MTKGLGHKYCGIYFLKIISVYLLLMQFQHQNYECRGGSLSIHHLCQPSKCNKNQYSNKKVIEASVNKKLRLAKKESK